MAQGEYFYLLPDNLGPGLPLEFGSGNSIRRYYVIEELSETSIRLRRYKSAREACEAATLDSEPSSQDREKVIAQVKRLMTLYKIDPSEIVQTAPSDPTSQPCEVDSETEKDKIPAPAAGGILGIVSW